MPTNYQLRLVHQATEFGTDLVLHDLSVEYSRELHAAIRQGIRQAVLYYVQEIDGQARELHPLDQAGEVRA
jgi:hypothetical protein